MPKNKNGFDPSPIGETKPIEKEDLMPNGMVTPQDELKENAMRIKKEWLIGGLILYCIFK